MVLQAKANRQKSHFLLQRKRRHAAAPMEKQRIKRIGVKDNPAVSGAGLRSSSEAVLDCVVGHFRIVLELHLLQEPAAVDTHSLDRQMHFLGHVRETLA